MNHLEGKCCVSVLFEGEKVSVKVKVNESCKGKATLEGIKLIANSI